MRQCGAIGHREAWVEIAAVIGDDLASLETGHAIDGVRVVIDRKVR